MCKPTVTETGLAYRTKLMRDYRAAERFAKCLEANALFCDVEVVESKQAKHGGWFVTFKPSNKERQADMLEREWDVRGERAQAEGMDYTFWQDPDEPTVWWCYNPLSGETYEVTIFSCSCPDYKFRCNRIGIQCKHMLAWEFQSEAGVLTRAAQLRRAA